ncbi:hypothetical protein M758_12G104600 [Ceratodon purpureus]|nr:hypothetical protein M758_12G104600 [Ceratodon purpureus]
MRNFDALKESSFPTCRRSRLLQRLTRQRCAKVVEEASARHGYIKFLSVAADHFGVCTPETRVSSSFQFMRRFVEDVVVECSDRLLEVPSLMVGMEERLEEVRRKLERHSRIGVVGMGVIGKTTLSKHFYNLERKDFEKSCFLEDVKSVDVKNSQKELYRDFCGNLSEEKDFLEFHLQQIRQCIVEEIVLLVVDDVGIEENLKALLVDAFGSGNKGSKVIVTTRRQDILIGGMDPEAILDLDCLNDDQAIDLFSHYAFDHLGNNEKLELDGLAKDISKACGGLPLSIEVMGQFLRKYGHA